MYFTASRGAPVFWLLLLSTLFSPAVSADDLRRALERSAAGDAVRISGEPINAGLELLNFYQRRDFSTVWNADKLAALNAEILAASADGLLPEDYHLEAISTASSSDTTSVELLASQALLRLASDLRAGRLDPQYADPDWELAYSRPVGVEVLQKFADGAVPLKRLLQQQRPPQPGYQKLREALTRLQQRTDDEWPVIKDLNRLEPGDSQPAVASLRRYLQLAPGSDRYDEELLARVQNFQTSNGLTADGRIGPATLAALNVSRASRIQQLRANLERWRWLPNELGDRQIRVNIAAFQVDVIEQGEKKFTQRVVVGTPVTKTPTFSARMTYIVANPYWNVPTDIVKKELLPKERSQPGYLAGTNYEVLTSWDANAAVMSSSAVQAAAQRGSYVRIRQKPGDSNALGRLKFMFPNSHDVYMHDTPSKNLFKKDQRAFSHGCIRLADPVGLARHLLRDQPNVDLDNKISSLRETTIPLRHPYSVHITYFTAWVDDSGELQFRNDIYGRDTRLLAALNKT